MGQGCCSLRGAELEHTGLTGHSSKWLQVRREPLCSIWDSSGYNHPQPEYLEEAEEQFRAQC